MLTRHDRDGALPHDPSCSVSSTSITNFVSTSKTARGLCFASTEDREFRIGHRVLHSCFASHKRHTPNETAKTPNGPDRLGTYSHGVSAITSSNYIARGRQFSHPPPDVPRRPVRRLVEEAGTNASTTGMSPEQIGSPGAIRRSVDR